MFIQYPLREFSTRDTTETWITYGYSQSFNWHVGKYKDVPLLEFVYLVFTRLTGELLQTVQIFTVVSCVICVTLVKCHWLPLHPGNQGLFVFQIVTVILLAELLFECPLHCVVFLQMYPPSLSLPVWNANTVRQSGGQRCLRNSSQSFPSALMSCPSTSTWWSELGTCTERGNQTAGPFTGSAFLWM